MPLSLKIINQVLGDNDYHVEASAVEALVTVLCSSHPVQKAIVKQGPLSTSWKGKQYYRREFGLVSPVEYILDKRNKKSLQYVSMLKNIAADSKFRFCLDKDCQFERETSVIRNNTLLSKDYAISLNLYIDDFEICNPIGTSQRKHKICALYWTLGNLSPGCQ